ncbi:MAG: hypothetical protein JNK87_37460 [Bryobacterales bacterium]|nr:hypothetical protein [Bryobacterales bacterium]
MQERLSELFGSYKAEWLRDHVFDLFTEPAYFPELMTARPCVLVGGRGTGKTTVLRGLSYEGQFAIGGKDTSRIRNWPFYGFYYRVNTNRVTALRGDELSEEQWVRLFAHYFNLIACDLVMRFVQWYGIHTLHPLDLSFDTCLAITTALHLEAAGDTSSLGKAIKVALIRFESYVNNVSDSRPSGLSMQGAGLDLLLQALSEHKELAGKQFYFLLDEYENFEDYQQQVINTLIKHSGSLYTFKIGVRELGWRRRTTLNENEQLISPADYVRINISDQLDGERFTSFATAVCNDRLFKLADSFGQKPIDIASALTSFTEDEEAEKLGIRERLQSLFSQLKDEGANPAVLDDVERLPALEAYLIYAWARAQGSRCIDVYYERAERPVEWTTRISNYKHSLLYMLRKGKRGIRKYYCGWSVFVQLAAGNIRYVLELVDNALLLHLQRQQGLAVAISPEIQTTAAQNVGRKNLSELEGLSVHGAHLTKLLLSLGRVFQVMAAEPAGHVPELNQFHLEDADRSFLKEDTEDERALRLLDAAVMHLALVRSRGSKPADETDTREYDYMIHPIYSAFFVFSYRKKRKMLLSAHEVVGLIQRPKETIRDILARHRRNESDDLPQQVLPFAAYYRGTSE